MNRRYALIQVYKENDDSTVDGTWLRNCTACTLEDAIARARAKEQASKHGIKVAVVDALDFGVTDYNYKKRLVRYDKEE